MFILLHNSYCSYYFYCMSTIKKLKCGIVRKHDSYGKET